MTTAYFLTGSCNGQDSDFELTVTVTNSKTARSRAVYQTVLTDIADGSRRIWETSQPDFLKCLDAMDQFLSGNFIILYSKILVSAQRDPIIDKELEGYILNHLEL